MSTRKILGIIFIALPFIGLFLHMVESGGLESTLKFLGSITAMIVSLYIGLVLVENKKSTSTPEKTPVENTETT